MNEPIIRLVGVERAYATPGGRVLALRDVHLEIAGGEMVAIMGASGSGKSTLLNILGLLDRPTAGEYHLDGRDVSRLSEHERADQRGRSLGFVFQAFHLLPHATARANVAMPLLYGGGDPTAADRALARVGLADRADHRPGELSGGQQGRVAIARALVNDPRVILADEPTGALDSSTSREVLDLFRELNEDGRTIIVVTHDEEVARRCDRVIAFRDGAIVSDERS